MNYYERHLGDYAKDTTHLSMLEHGAYALLLDRYYSSEEGILDQIKYKICQTKNQKERSAVDFILSSFFELVDGRWINKRAEIEINKYKKRVVAAQENGKKGGRPKASDNPTKTHRVSAGFNPVNPNETQQKALHTPCTIHQEEYIPATLSEYAEFARNFQNHVLAEHGAKAPKINEALIRRCAEEVDKLIRIDGHTLDQVKSVMRWAVKDEFWAPNAMSLAALRKKGDDGRTKFQKILAAKERQVAPQSGGWTQAELYAMRTIN